MNTKGLKELIGNLLKVLGPPGPNTDTIKSIITKAYLEHNNISDATLYLVNELFGQYGLVILNPDNAALKSSFIDVVSAYAVRNINDLRVARDRGDHTFHDADKGVAQTKVGR